jgi:hypothetical protein
MSANIMPWFRMYTESVDDEKLRLLAFEDRWHFVALLCCKGQGILDDSGPLLRRKIAVKLEISIAELDALADRLAVAGLIDPVTLQPSTHLIFKPSRPAAHIWNAIRSRIFARDNYTCRYCGERGKKLECDHVHSVARGGSHEDDNLVTACRPCNRSKRDKFLDEWSPK